MLNALAAINVLTSLLTQALQVSAMIQQAQATGVDLTADQLTGLANDYNTALAKLNADIAAAIAAGK